MSNTHVWRPLIIHTCTISALTVTNEGLQPNIHVRLSSRNKNELVSKQKEQNCCLIICKSDFWVLTSQGIRTFELVKTRYWNVFFLSNLKSNFFRSSILTSVKSKSSFNSLHLLSTSSNVYFKQILSVGLLLLLIVSMLVLSVNIHLCLHDSPLLCECLSLQFPLSSLNQ